MDERLGNRGMGKMGKSVEWLTEQLREMAIRDAALEKMWAVLGEAMDAETTRRDGTKADWQYQVVPDHPTRLAAAKLTADVLGITQKGGINLNVADNRVVVTVRDQLTEFAQIGGDPGEILRDMERVIADAKAAGIKPALELPAEGAKADGPVDSAAGGF